ncbi:MAG: hypothetical protein IT569_05335 [Leptospiraceae bacterium]|nr:hypothetical protein [Leptospiraceae bacterium]
MSERFYLYYATKPGKQAVQIKSPAVANNVSYPEYLHNPDKKRMSFVTSTESDRGSFVRDFQLANPNYRIINTSTTPSKSQAKKTVTPAVKNEIAKQSTGEGGKLAKQTEKESGNAIYYLVGAIGVGVIGIAIYSSMKGKKKKRK